MLLANGPIRTELFLMTAVSKIYFHWDCELLLTRIKMIHNFSVYLIVYVIEKQF